MVGGRKEVNEYKRHRTCQLIVGGKWGCQWFCQDSELGYNGRGHQHFRFHVIYNC